MTGRAWIAWFVVLGPCAAASVRAQPVPESVYAPPDLPKSDEVVDVGAVDLDLGVSYFTDYVYRGVEVFEPPGHEDSANVQFDAKLAVDLGKLPHPYVAVFVNLADADAVSDVQEVRPSAGVDWKIKPLVFSGGLTAYLYPDRGQRQTSEAFVGVALDDTILIKGLPLPSPFATAAYDFDSYNGIYAEAGVRYRVPVEDTGLTLTASAEIAYVAGYRARLDGDDDTTEPGFFTSPRTIGRSVNGLQHYQFGLVADYALNDLLGLPSRSGELSVRGYLYYTDGLSDEVEATTQVWGGVGVNFSF